jgi:hypothetical protein
MRYAQVTMIYVLPVPEDQVDEAFDAVMSAGVSRLEDQILGTARNINSIKSDWQLMPKEFMPDAGEATITRGRVVKRWESEDAKRIIEADADRGISFTRDVMGQGGRVRHPHDQGLYIFPDDHPLGGLERKLVADGQTEALRELHANAPKLKEADDADGTAAEEAAQRSLPHGETDH